MSTVSTSSLNEAMKVVTSIPLINNVVSDSELLGLFEADSDVQQEKTTGGRYIETSQLFALHGAVGARAEGDYLPVPTNAVFKNGRINLRTIYASEEMSGHVMRRVINDEGSFLNWAEESLPLLVKRLVSDLDRQAVGYGAGVIAQTSQTFQGGGSPYTFTVNNSFGVSGLTQPWLNFMEGQSLVFSATATGAYRNAGTNQAATITAIAESTNTLTVTADTTLAAAVGGTDYIFNGDASGGSGQGGGGTNREMQGLLAGADDGTIVATYLNIARSGNRYWQSVIVDASGAAFGGTMSEDLLQYGDDECSIRGNGKINAFVFSRSAARSLWKVLKQDRVFVDPRAYTGTGNGAGPAKSGLVIMLGDRTVPVKVCRKLSPELAFGLTTSSWKRPTLGVFEWDDKTGSIWNRVVDSTGRKDAYFAVGQLSEELVCLAPRQNVKFTNLTAVT